MASPVLIASATFDPTAPVPGATPVNQPIRQGHHDPRRLWLEAGAATWLPSLQGIILPGATGLGLPPVDPVSRELPGIAGTQLVEVKVGEREVFVPIYLASDTSPRDFIDARTAFEEMIWPLGDGAEFRLVAQDHRGIRELPCTYVEGLAGDEGRTASGSMWATLGLRFKAADPWWRHRFDLTLPFGLRNDGSAIFLGEEGDPNTAPWPRRIASSVVLGMGMEINITSSVPPYPTLELDGPMDSFTGTTDTGWHIHVDQPIPAGQTLRVVTDPRRKSTRLDGNLAAGMIARGARLIPFRPGVNRLDVLAPGSGEGTQMRLSWRPQYRSAWGGR